MLQFKLYHESNEKALKIFQQEKTLLDFFCTINVNYGACHAYNPILWEINLYIVPCFSPWSHSTPLANKHTVNTKWAGVVTWPKYTGLLAVHEKKKVEPKRLFLGNSNQKILGEKKELTTEAQVKKIAVRRKDAGMGMTQ